MQIKQISFLLLEWHAHYEVRTLNYGSLHFAIPDKQHHMHTVSALKTWYYFADTICVDYVCYRLF